MLMFFSPSHSEEDRRLLSESVWDQTKKPKVIGQSERFSGSSRCGGAHVKPEVNHEKMSIVEKIFRSAVNPAFAAK